MSSRPDSQQVELMGRAWLMTQLMRDDIEVAVPERDMGIDLIAYLNRGRRHPFVAYPVQLKASSSFSFGFARKYERFHDLLFAFVWYLDQPNDTEAAFMTKRDVVAVCRKMGWTTTPSWKGTTPSAKTGGAGYRVGSRSQRLSELLEPYIMKPGAWRATLEQATGISGTTKIVG